MSILTISLAAGDAGPVMVLSGETDITTVRELTDALNAQMTDGVRRLTIDISALRFADTASIRALVLSARSLNERGGALELLNPSAALASALALMGVEHIFSIRTQTSQPGPDNT
ncbi:MAG TPA: STAS domain-containing protein [Streptosporangiaceae bacterium]